MTSLHVRITGRVQGVGFRWFVRQRAKSLGVAGWALNRLDGSVEVAARGPEDALAAFRTSLHDGPAGARVDHLEDLPPVPDDTLPDDFRIERFGG